MFAFGVQSLIPNKTPMIFWPVLENGTGFIEASPSSATSGICRNCAETVQEVSGIFAPRNESIPEDFDQKNSEKIWNPHGQMLGQSWISPVPFKIRWFFVFQPAVDIPELKIIPPKKTVELPAEVPATALPLSTPTREKCSDFMGLHGIFSMMFHGIYMGSTLCQT